METLRKVIKLWNERSKLTCGAGCLVGRGVVQSRLGNDDQRRGGDSSKSFLVAACVWRRRAIKDVGTDVSQGRVIQSAPERCLDWARVRGGGPTWVQAKLMVGVTLAGVD